MELKVWVDGVLRVVCGLSEDTTCQEVVIALAQAIGQTGRYVLVQKMRDTERQLLADERPLQTLAKLGQLGNEVRFILRRTGPTSGGSGGSSSSSTGSITSSGSNSGGGGGGGGGGPPRPPDRTTSLAPLPPLPKHLHPEVPPKRRDAPKKALTFNLGPSTAPHTQPKHFKKPPPPKDSPELRRLSPSPSPSPAQSPSPSPILPPPTPATSSTPPPPPPPPGPSKEELFRRILQQQEDLGGLGERLERAQQEVWVLEQPPPPLLTPDLLEELDQLEEAMRRSKAELAHAAHWEEELRAEEEREEAMRQEVEQLRVMLEEHGQQLADCGGQTGRLELQLQEAVQRREAHQRNGLKQAQVTQESLDAAQAELERRQRLEAELQSSLGEAEQELETADKMLQAKTQELDELNKELRQCNLQQFIQQTGAPLNMSSSQMDLRGEESELIEVSQLVMDTDTDSATSEDSGLFSSESQPALTARQILVNTRSTKKPLGEQCIHTYKSTF
ncbi:ras association domain-containing protein 8-like [Engraulis encrasicolus]|uniref:ras association domain-containing protein 8-like n=1 Tax=Engraulis encrasicolus TaxID=184585 RepID=UPI002FD0346B